MQVINGNLEKVSGGTAGVADAGESAFNRIEISSSAVLEIARPVDISISVFGPLVGFFRNFNPDIDMIRV